MEKTIITLTTDWGYNDFFAGKVKGKLLSQIPDAQIIDISHGIEQYKISQAAFVVEHACMEFPAGTIHIVDVSYPNNADAKYVAVRYRQQYFIGADNGLFYSVFQDQSEEQVLLPRPKELEFNNFVAHTIYCDAAIKIAQGIPLSEIGTRLDKLTSITKMMPIVSSRKLTIPFNYFDSYGNAYLNMTYEEFEKIRKGRSFTFNIRGHAGEQITAISHNYEIHQENTRLLLTVSSVGLLEIAMSFTSANQMLDLEELDGIDVFFSE